jgi:hypothetical protein
MIAELFAAFQRFVRFIIDSLRRAAKLTIAVALIVGSTLAFGVWWFTRSPKALVVQQISNQHQQEDIGKRVAQAEAAMGRLVMVDNDLFNVETGELIFANWLKHGMPFKIFWEPDSKTVLAQYGEGFIRYGMDGTEKASIVLSHPFAIADDYKWIAFSKDGDIWQADVDWKSFKLTNQRKVTSVDQFDDVNFAGNIVLGSDKTLLVNHLSHILRVDLATGEVHPVKIPMTDIHKRRSPDSKWVVGIQNGQFYCYDLDTDEAKSVQIGRGAVNDYQWLSNDRCVAIAAGKDVILYDRLKHTLTELCPLPFPCNRVGEPSPDGRFAFCKGSRPGAPGLLVDTTNQTTTPIAGGNGVSWVSNDTFTFSREVPDSSMRGTWMQSVGGEEKRVAPEPYLVSNRGESVMRLKSAGLLVFAINQGVMKMKSDGSEAAQTIKAQKPSFQLVEVAEWKQ